MPFVGLEEVEGGPGPLSPGGYSSVCSFLRYPETRFHNVVSRIGVEVQSSQGMWTFAGTGECFPEATASRSEGSASF